jgi:hypothetical protein
MKMAKIGLKPVSGGKAWNMSKTFAGFQEGGGGMRPEFTAAIGFASKLGHYFANKKNGHSVQEGFRRRDSMSAEGANQERCRRHERRMARIKSTKRIYENCIKSQGHRHTLSVSLNHFLAGGGPEVTLIADWKRIN